MNDTKPFPHRSYIRVMHPVLFECRAPAWMQVYLVGDFNGWHAGRLPMRRHADCWRLSVNLAPGRYAFGFLVGDSLLERSRIIVRLPASRSTDGRLRKMAHRYTCGRHAWKWN